MSPKSEEEGRDAAKAERVFERLRSAIETGEYGPGERLVEAPLAKSLGVSRNTLRMVLVRLEREGMVTLEANRGASVRVFSLSEAHDLSQVREVLEGLVARLATQRASDDDLHRLAALVDEAADALAGDDVVRFTRLNRAFHTALVELAGSPLAGGMLESLHFPMMKFQYQAAMVPGRKAENLAEHQAILAALESGDADKAELVARAHVHQARLTLDRIPAAG